MWDRYVFMWQPLEILSVFNTLTLNQLSQKQKLFSKNWTTVFLVEKARIINATFPYNIALSEANAKTNRVGSTIWTYHKERSFASNCFNFPKILFQFKILYKDLIWCTNQPNVNIHTFWKRWDFTWVNFFLVSIFKLN